MTVHISSLPTEAAAPIPDAGLGALTTERGNLPLDAVDVHAGITGLAAGVRIVQEFRNPYDVPLEATYVFPLPDRAAVTSLRMEAADRVIEGRLKERGEARAEYDSAIAAGRRAAIAEEDRPDVFTMRVGNVLPGERVTVRLGLSQPLPYEFTPPAAGDAAAEGEPAGAGHGAGTATFRFPLVVAPRYVPGTPLPGTPAGDGTAPDTDAVPDASRISPPVLLPGFPDPVRLSVTVDIDPAGLPLTDVRSSLHVIATEPTRAAGGSDGAGGRVHDGDSDGDSDSDSEERSGRESGALPPANRMTVRLQPGERLDRDFILRLGFAAPESAALSLVPDRPTDPGAAKTGDTDLATPTGTGTMARPEGTFTLTVLPSGETFPRPRDVVLVLDRSGSMGGWKMVAARRAAARIIDTLTTADRFAVLSFDDRVEWPAGLPQALTAATDRNRFRAVEHLAGLEARYGTELLEPMRQAAGLLDDPERDRVLVLITDGQVGNEDEILARIQPALRGARVHTVGIDRAVNAGFLGRLAMMGDGRFELVESEDRLDEAMEHIHHRIAAPLVTGLTLDASGIEIVPGTVTPARLGALFPGVPLVIAGRFRSRTPARRDADGDGGDGSARGAGDTTDAADRKDPVDPATITVRGLLGDGGSWERRVAAGATDDRASVDIWARGHLRDLEDRYVVVPSDDLEQRIVDTSLRFGVLCRFTAFVAVDSRVVTDGGTPHRVTQPVEQPSGWSTPRAPIMTAGHQVAYAAAPPLSAMPPAPGSAPSGPPPAPMMAPAPMMPPAPGVRAGAARGVRRAFSGRPGPAGSAAAGGGPFDASATGAAGTTDSGVPGQPQGEVPLSARTLVEVRERLREELERMTGQVPVPEQRRRLSDLRTRLGALLVQLTDGGVLEGLYEALTSLTAELQAVDDPARRSEVPALWDRTISVLTEFVRERGPVVPAAPHPRKPFWKRNP